MLDAGKTLCPFCSKEFPEPINLCWHCGKDMHGMKLVRRKAKTSFYIVPDGSKFGIAMSGDIKIHGLDRWKAESLLEILNSVSATEEIG